MYGVHVIPLLNTFTCKLFSINSFLFKVWLPYSSRRIKTEVIMIVTNRNCSGNIMYFWKFNYRYADPDIRTYLLHDPILIQYLYSTYCYMIQSVFMYSTVQWLSHVGIKLSRDKVNRSNLSHTGFGIHTGKLYMLGMGVG